MMSSFCRKRNNLGFRALALVNHLRLKGLALGKLI